MSIENINGDRVDGVINNGLNYLALAADNQRRYMQSSVSPHEEDQENEYGELNQRGNNTNTLLEIPATENDFENRMRRSGSSVTLAGSRHWLRGMTPPLRGIGQRPITPIDGANELERENEFARIRENNQQPQFIPPRVDQQADAPAAGTYGCAGRREQPPLADLIAMILVQNEQRDELLQRKDERLERLLTQVMTNQQNAT